MRNPRNATGTVDARHRLPGCAGRADGPGILATGPASMRGFTLIEVIVAFAVLALALTLLLGTLSGAAKQVRWADDAGRAALHAQSLLDETGVGETLQPGQRDGEFEDGRYRWSLQVEPWRDQAARDPALIDPGASQLMRLTLEVQWGDGGPRQRLQLQSLRLVTPDPREALSLP